MLQFLGRMFIFTLKLPGGVTSKVRNDMWGYRKMPVGDSVGKSGTISVNIGVSFAIQKSSKLSIGTGLPSLAPTKIIRMTFRPFNSSWPVDGGPGRSSHRKCSSGSWPTVTVWRGQCILAVAFSDSRIPIVADDDVVRRRRLLPGASAG